MRYEIDIFHYVGVYKKEWKKMAYAVGAAMLISAVMAFMKPAIYRSTAIILSPKENTQMTGLNKILGMISTNTSSEEVVFSMLKSQRMRGDVDEYFDARKTQGFWWSIDTYSVIGGFAIEVKGSGPDMTKEITDFAIGNLDKINGELQVTTQKPMVKVLDPAGRGTPMPKQASKRAVASSLFVFMVYTLFVFFREYLGNLKKQK